MNTSKGACSLHVSLLMAVIRLRVPVEALLPRSLTSDLASKTVWLNMKCFSLEARKRRWCCVLGRPKEAVCSFRRSFSGQHSPLHSRNKSPVVSPLRLPRRPCCPRRPSRGPYSRHSAGRTGVYYPGAYVCACVSQDKICFAREHKHFCFIWKAC